MATITMWEIFCKKFFQSLLRKNLEETYRSINVVSVKGVPRIRKGIRYVSRVYSAHVKFVARQRSNDELVKGTRTFIVKTYSPRKKSNELMTEHHAALSNRIFLREFKMLDKVLPQIEEMVNTRIGPQIVKTSSNTFGIFVMKDLKLEDYYTRNRREGLKLEECRAVMRLMAKLHAGSVALHEKEPELVESFADGGLLNPNNCPDNFSKLTDKTLRNVIETSSKWKSSILSESVSKLKDVREILEKNWSELCCRIYKYNKEEFCVLNHGECWIKNLMFKNEGKDIDVRMVDFQTPVYSSPAIDLHHFLHTSPNPNYIYSHDNALLKIYRDTLVEEMNKLNCDTERPSMDDLKEAMRKRELYAVIVGLIFRLRMLVPEKKTENLEKVLDVDMGNTEMRLIDDLNTENLTQRMLKVMRDRQYFNNILHNH